MPKPNPAPLTFGWEQWIGLPAISAKVDTGARNRTQGGQGLWPQYGQPYGQR